LLPFLEPGRNWWSRLAVHVLIKMPASDEGLPSTVLVPPPPPADGYPQVMPPTFMHPETGACVISSSRSAQLSVCSSFSFLLKVGFNCLIWKGSPQLVTISVPPPFSPGDLSAPHKRGTRFLPLRIRLPGSFGFGAIEACLHRPLPLRSLLSPPLIFAAPLPFVGC